MPRETKAAKTARIGAILAEYDAASRDARKVSKRVEELKAQIRAEIEPGTYGDWAYSEGTPSERLDQEQAKARLRAAGLEVPTFFTKPSVVVKPLLGVK